MKKRFLATAMVGLSLVVGCAAPVMADSRKVVTLGADLSEEQKNTMMKYFGVSYDSVDLIYINNTDEREHLGSYVPLEQIGSYTYSCALVSPTSSGGIQVKTANLDWVTCNMIATTLSTSGVTNCQVVAAAPFKVSGTGALTGVIMAYETASQQTLDPVKKDLANQELVATGNLANEVGQSKAIAIINETKIEVVENNITNVEEITNIVNNVSYDYGVTINEDQSEVIAELMQKIAEQEYDITQLKATLDTVQANVAGDAGASEEEQAAAEQKARESQLAAEQAAAAAQIYADEYEELQNDAVTEETENILENTDVSALEQNGSEVNEGDTTSTVLEQESEQAETVEDLGIPEATADGSVAEAEDAAENEDMDLSAENTDDVNADDSENDEDPAAETENAADENQETELAEAESEVLTEADAESEMDAEQLGLEEKAIYDEVTKDLDELFEETVFTDAETGYTMYLTEEAAAKVPEVLEAYLLNLLAKGSEQVAEEEAADLEIPQNILEETVLYAEDREYEEEAMQLLDKYVRRLVFMDSEELLADSMLEEADEVYLYEQIMKLFEKAYKVETEVEETETLDAFAEDNEGDAAEVSDDTFAEDYSDDTYDEEEYAEDEFADFEEQEGVF